MKPLGDLGEAAAEASEKAFEYEAKLLPLPDDPEQWLNDAWKEVKALRDDHPQKKILITYIKAGLKCITPEGMNIESLKAHILMIHKNWHQIEGEKIQAGRDKAGAERGRQQKERGEVTRQEILKRWDKGPQDKHQAVKIANKLKITPQRVRQVLREEKRK